LLLVRPERPAVLGQLDRVRLAVDVPGDSPPVAPAEDDHDALLRRLRELGELHRTGVLTDDEFTAAKQAVLKRM
ncbi:SHOCT domain-containing protein, partial [Streptomyces sp. NPDC006135]|uniref:SHOCT domain-containing protein n=1 Tax=Streptomyces sp. NPDC006135 TaxID=3154577 RepID=UPI0033E0BC0D